MSNFYRKNAQKINNKIAQVVFDVKIAKKIPTAKLHVKN